MFDIRGIDVSYANPLEYIHYNHRCTTDVSRTPAHLFFYNTKSLKTYVVSFIQGFGIYSHIVHVLQSHSRTSVGLFLH